jgi:arylsulfatase A-like enzyme
MLAARLCLAILFALTARQAVLAENKPNVLFISVDDLNDWTGCLGGHPQAKTPNLDRLAASGVLFTNAHCPAPACNPSRGSILTGISPHASGLYDNRQSMRERMPDAELLPKHLSNHGYWSAGSGKLLHYFIDSESWDEYYPPKETEDPFPRTFYPKQRPVSLPRGGPWQYVETDWAALDVSDEAFGGDWLVSKWISEQLLRQHEDPFFLACGIYRPHEPWFVPKKYFDPFPLDELQLPPGYLENDLADVPSAGKKLGPNRYFEHIQKQGQWRLAIQGYLASIHFADAMLGRVLDALESGPNRDNTIVILWSDHGWHLGEKQHWQKYTGWRVCTRVPLIIRVPPRASGLPSGTEPGFQCNAPVNLLSLYPTVTELAGIPSKETNSGPSLVPLLRNPNADWPHVSVTYLGRPGNYAVSGKRFRYIAYDNGDHELYDIESDRHEWNNLASNAEYADTIDDLKRRVPTEVAAYEIADIGSLPKLNWNPIDRGDAPNSRPHGKKLSVRFSNQTGQPVKVFVVTRDGQRQSYGVLETGWSKPNQTYPGSTWLITDLEEKPLGYFTIGDQPAHAVIPTTPP